jgi:hypothetical protein
MSFRFLKRFVVTLTSTVAGSDQLYQPQKLIVSFGRISVVSDFSETGLPDGLFSSQKSQFG